LVGTGAFQYFAYLFSDQATGIREGKRQFGDIIGIRCVQSVDARLAEATQIPWDVLMHLGKRITNEIPSVCRVLYEITSKPPATIEVI
jgi:GMP synthase (glutamine-hydrolysing)